MGMAASQARYLALVARKSNCEYEGQQINQARTALSNQSANLFNQMLTLQVPVPPSTQDFTKTQYSYTDGLNASTIDSWQQLASPEEDYNYVVTHHYYTDIYTGSEKKLSDPQVQFTGTPVDLAKLETARVQVETAEATYNNAVKAYEDSKVEYSNARRTYSDLNSYASSFGGITDCDYEEASGTYTLTSDGDSVYTAYSKLAEGDVKDAADATVQALIEAGAISASDKNNLYFSADGTSFAFGRDLALLATNATADTPETLNTYSSADVGNNKTEVDNAKTAMTQAELAMDGAETALVAQQKAYNDLAHPSFVGNCDLIPLASLTKDQEAEIAQIVRDMEAQGITSDIVNYYNPATGKYTGGIYSFKMNGNTYYTTYTDLENSYKSGSGINNIDAQIKLPYYNATYVSTKVEKTEKALLETDGTGRFSSIRFQDDSVTYTLNMETITDDVAYQDAMNQYYYENAKYDKIIQDINAKTSIIQREDQQLELRLKQLDTEHNALSNEIDAVQKVVKDNVEKSFKTFGG